MKNGLQLVTLETKTREVSIKINSCPICGLNGGNGAICESHAVMTKNFNWLKDYINSQEKLDKRLVYVIEFSIRDRKSMIINDVDIVNGKLIVKEYLDDRLEKKKCSLWLERTLKEILALEKAKGRLINMIKEGV